MRIGNLFISPRRFQALVLAPCLAAAVLGQAVCAQPQAALPNASRNASGNASAIASPNASPNALATAVQNLGLTRCAPALERLSTAGVQGARGNDVLIDWDRKRAATSPVFSMIGLAYGDTAGAAMTVTTVPEADGSCSVSAERITVAPIPCASVAQQELPGTLRTQLLPNFAVHTDPKDRTSSVSLIDTPPGCLVIRRYVEFNWKDPGAAVR